MERDRGGAGRPSLGTSRIPGRETAATRRLRTFLAAAQSFDCSLSDREFDDLFRAIAPPKAATTPSNRTAGGDFRTDEALHPILESDAGGRT
jgi:hypothetical protein